MFDALTRERPEGCVSDLALDGWMADELPESRAAFIAEHVRVCARCSARHAAFIADQDALLAEGPAGGLRAAADGRKSEPTPSSDAPTLQPPVPVGAPVARRVAHNPMRYPGVAGALAAAALAAVALLALRPQPPGERTKGTALFGFYVKDRGAITRAQPGGEVPAGATIRFVYSVERAVHLAVISRDPAGQLSVYYPPGERAAPVEPGRDVAVDSALVLDASTGKETLWALFCDAPESLAHLQTVLSDDERAVPPGCQVQQFQFTKVARP